MFPPEESPFLSGPVKAEQLRGEQQRLWDVVTRVLKPRFAATRTEQISTEDSKCLYLSALTSSMANRGATGMGKSYQNFSKSG